MRCRSSIGSQGKLFFVASLCLALAACGRSPLPGGAAPGADLGVADQGVDRAPRPDTFVPAPDKGTADSGPCKTGCVPTCKLLTSCGLFPAGAPACLQDCPSFTPETTQCLDGLVCAASPDCAAAKQCVVAPPALPDLRVTKVDIKVTGRTVDYAFEVCNAGKGVVPLPFSIELFWDTPGPGAKADWTMKIPAGLPPGGCGPATARRSNAPEGSYQSWLQIDPELAIVETNEKNNVVGPLPVKVELPKFIDLYVKRFDAKVNGPDIDYEAEICNKGTGNAWIFRADLFYNSAFAPLGLLGDHSFNFFSGLAAGACQVVKHSYKNAPVRNYASWLKVDGLNAVAESDEGNNTSGPKQVNVQAAPGCAVFCSFATGCGLVAWNEQSRCQTWCTGFSPAERSCASDAQSKLSCGQLKKCTLPPLPPPPPPLTACLTVCNHLVDVCKLLPGDQRLTCLAGCATLPATKKQCALDAQKQGQCAQMMLCLF